VVNGTASASAIPPTADRAISIATPSLVSTSDSDRLATLNSNSSGRELPA
jgi:septum formation inhibitor-activating ATPase MinD